MPINWIQWMNIFGQTDPEALSMVDETWVDTMCQVAYEKCLTDVPNLKRRLERGYISERMIAQVVCSMVMRVAANMSRHKRSESNGTYSYTNQTPTPVSTMLRDRDDNLYLSTSERNTLAGRTGGALGTIPMGLDRIYGL